MVQTSDGTRLAHEAAAHVLVSGIVAQDDLDGDAPAKGTALPPLVDGPHATYTDATYNVIISKLLAFQRQHWQQCSFPNKLLEVWSVVPGGQRPPGTTLHTSYPFPPWGVALGAVTV